FHRARREFEQTPLVRASRLADSYLPIGGLHDHEPVLVDGMVDIPASRFLRPVGKSAVLERLRLWRITSAMETAARRPKLFHLWWHPHNFGVDLQENLAFLRAILDCFRALQERYGMRSMTMAALADDVLQAQGQTGGGPAVRRDCAHRAFGLGLCSPPIPVTVETRNLLRSAGTRFARDEPGTGCQIRCACLSSNRAKADDQSPWTCIRTRSGHAAEPSKSTMKLQTDFSPSIAATTSSILPSDMGAISSIACGRAAYRNCHPERYVSILDVASAPIWLVSLIKVSRSPASNRVPRCAGWQQKIYQPILFPTAQCCNCRHPPPRSTSSTRSRFLDISTRAIMLKVTGRLSDR